LSNLEPYIQRGVGNTLNCSLDDATQAFLKVLRGKGAVGINDQAIVFKSNANGILKERIITRSGNLDLEVAQGCFPELSGV
jgi:hypothetical protein